MTCFPKKTLNFPQAKVEDGTGIIQTFLSYRSGIGLPLSRKGDTVSSTSTN